MASEPAWGPYMGEEHPNQAPRAEQHEKAHTLPLLPTPSPFLCSVDEGECRVGLLRLLGLWI